MNEATATDLRVFEELKDKGWKRNDTLLYQPQYKLTKEQQKQFQGRAYIKPDFVLQSLNGDIFAVIENKHKDPKKALPQLRLLYSLILKPKFLYACSDNKNLFYDMSWRGLDSGEFRPVNEFLSLEEMKSKIHLNKKKASEKPIEIDTLIAGGYDPTAGKDRYYQLDCVNVLINNIKNNKQKMLVHMATGLGKTRTSVALVKALFQSGMAKRILFVVDRRLLAKQAKDDGFSLISPEYNSAWITTSNFRVHRNKDIHIVVIDTLELLHKSIPSNFYDLLIVDECHRSITLNRKIIFDHFVCPRIGLTATPKIAIPQQGQEIPEEDLAIIDTYKLFGCESGNPDYEFNIDRGIEEKFLAPYTVEQCKSLLTRKAEESGVEFDHVWDIDEQRKIELGQTVNLRLEQLNRKYLTPNQAKRIAEEIFDKTEYGEKLLLFGVSQAHCLMLAKALNTVFHDDGYSNPRYAEAIISDNNDINDSLKAWFKKPFQKPYITISVDIMSTGVDIPCIRYIGFAGLTKSVGKYIQMLGRGTRLDPKKSGKFSFKILDFVGLCKRMEDNGKGSPKPNKKIVKKPGEGQGGGGGTGNPQGTFIIDNPDPKHMIQRVTIHKGAIKIIDNIPIEEAKKLFEDSVNNTTEKPIVTLKEKAKKSDFSPSEKDISIIQDWLKKPNIFLDEGILRKIYKYPGGSVWDFFLNVLKVKKLLTPKERLERGFDSYLSTSAFNEDQTIILKKLKKMFVSNIINGKDLSIKDIYSNPIYENILGSFEEINAKFDDKIDVVISEVKNNFNVPKVIQ